MRQLPLLLASNEATPKMETEFLRQLESISAFRYGVKFEPQPSQAVFLKPIKSDGAYSFQYQFFNPIYFPLNTLKALQPTLSLVLFFADEQKPQSQWNAEVKRLSEAASQQNLPTLFWVIPTDGNQFAKQKFSHKKLLQSSSEKITYKIQDLSVVNSFKLVSDELNSVIQEQAQTMLQQLDCDVTQALTKSDFELRVARLNQLLYCQYFYTQEDIYQICERYLKFMLFKGNSIITSFEKQLRPLNVELDFLLGFAYRPSVEPGKCWFSPKMNYSLKPEDFRISKAQNPFVANFVPAMDDYNGLFQQKFDVELVLGQVLTQDSHPAYFVSYIVSLMIHLETKCYKLERLMISLQQSGLRGLIWINLFIEMVLTFCKSEDIIYHFNLLKLKYFDMLYQEINVAELNRQIESVQKVLKLQLTTYKNNYTLYNMEFGDRELGGYQHLFQSYHFTKQFYDETLRIFVIEQCVTSLIETQTLLQALDVLLILKSLRNYPSIRRDRILRNIWNYLEDNFIHLSKTSQQTLVNQLNDFVEGSEYQCQYSNFRFLAFPTAQNLEQVNFDSKQFYNLSNIAPPQLIFEESEEFKIDQFLIHFRSSGRATKMELTMDDNVQNFDCAHLIYKCIGTEEQFKFSGKLEKIYRFFAKFSVQLPFDSHSDKQYYLYRVAFSKGSSPLYTIQQFNYQESIISSLFNLLNSANEEFGFPCKNEIFLQLVPAIQKCSINLLDSNPVFRFVDQNLAFNVSFDHVSTMTMDVELSKDITRTGKLEVIPVVAQERFGSILNHRRDSLQGSNRRDSMKNSFALASYGSVIIDALPRSYDSLDNILIENQKQLIILIPVKVNSKEENCVVNFSFVQNEKKTDYKVKFQTKDLLQVYYNTSNQYLQFQLTQFTIDLKNPLLRIFSEDDELLNENIIAVNSKDTINKVFKLDLCKNIIHLQFKFTHIQSHKDLEKLFNKFPSLEFLKDRLSVLKFEGQVKLDSTIQLQLVKFPTQLIRGNRYDIQYQYLVPENQKLRITQLKVVTNSEFFLTSSKTIMNVVHGSSQLVVVSFIPLITGEYFLPQLVFNVEPECQAIQKQVARYNVKIQGFEQSVFLV